MKYSLVQYGQKNEQGPSNFGEVFVNHIKLLELHTDCTRNMKSTNQTMVWNSGISLGDYQLIVGFFLENHQIY